MIHGRRRTGARKFDCGRAGSDARRTQAEQDASPNSGTMRMASGQKSPTCSTDRPRAALRFQPAELAEDLTVPLRRQMKS